MQRAIGPEDSPSSKTTRHTADGRPQSLGNAPARSAGGGIRQLGGIEERQFGDLAARLEGIAAKAADHETGHMSPETRDR